MLNYYLKEVLGVKSLILPLEQSPGPISDARAEPLKRWIVVDEVLNHRETELLEKMLKAVKLEKQNFKIILAKDAANLNMKKTDPVLWFSDRPWNDEEAQVTRLCAFKHFFELEGDALKELKKSIWEKLKSFVKNN